MSDTPMLIRDDVVYSTAEVARWLRVAPNTVWRWALDLGHPKRGSGTRIRLTYTDLLICRAWAALGTLKGGDYRPEFMRLRGVVAEALRTKPARHLVVVGTDDALTFDSWEDAVLWAFEHGRGRLRTVIDLEDPLL